MEPDLPSSETDLLIEELLDDRRKFNDFVYTPIHEAIEELKKRRIDGKLESQVKAFLNDDIPSPFQTHPQAVLARQLATPNYEVRRFMMIADVIEDLKPLLFEYHDDKFIPTSALKYSLGKLHFNHGVGKKGGVKLEYLNIIDFNKSNGKKISEVQTLWGQSLVDFHHELFKDNSNFNNSHFYDASSWCENHGKVARNYHEHSLSLYINHGVLFENYMIEDPKEKSFVKEIFLPAFINIYKTFGVKPLIVALEPTEVEGDNFWICHPSSSKGDVDNKLNIL